MTRSTFTGRKRKRTTSKAVLWMDRIAKTVITFGGIGTILAVLTVCVFLIIVVIPLFRGSHVAEDPPLVAYASEHARPTAMQLDEYQSLGWALYPGGRILVFRADTGEAMERVALFDGDEPTSAAVSSTHGSAVFGFTDGTVRRVQISFTTTYLEQDSVPPEIASLLLGERAAFERGIVQRTTDTQFRLQQVKTSIEEPLKSGVELPVVLVDQSLRSEGPLLAMLTSDMVLRLESVRERRNVMFNRIDRTAVLRGTLEIERRAGRMPDHLFLSGVGDNVFLIWNDGALQRIDTRDLDRPTAVELVDVVPEPGATLTAATFLIGKTTLITGDSAGNLRAWFRIKPDDTISPDGTLLVPAHDLPSTGAAILHVAPSTRGRTIAVAFADGTVRLLQVTSHKIIVEVDSGEGDIVALALAPKEDGIYVRRQDSFQRYSVAVAHPETTLAAIFHPVWYEGYSEPKYEWQSSSGTDSFEPKFGLMPLIFGTIKATIYCMLFGVPLAILAAIYTSEFLHPKVKAKVKPTIELMASLPSVVLGFLAALVFAPHVETHLVTILTSFVTVPVAFLVFAYLWQMLPSHAALGHARLKFLFSFLAVPAGILMASLSGPFVEYWLFSNDIMRWLANPDVGSGVAGWWFLLLPFTAFVLMVFVGRPLTSWWLPRGVAISRRQQALFELVKFLVLLAVTFAIAWLLAMAANGFISDPRNLFMGTYVQRNSLVVGFVMGFAVIPIIYTIAEDALSSVPEHLRAASLGAGATQWQTAIRVIIPTAMSGLFSAVMIGFGRAVGETMIVLMAAGNTPVMEMNIFNGFRTLSANIAVELPEAVRDSTHYRMLFFAALTLFVLTFAVNTVAEVVRQRFRKRAYQL